LTLSGPDARSVSDIVSSFDCEAAGWGIGASPYSGTLQIPQSKLDGPQAGYRDTRSRRPPHLLLDLVLKDEQVLLEHGVLACRRVGHQHLGR
jgi:hypothetical protein